MKGYLYLLVRKKIETLISERKSNVDRQVRDREIEGLDYIG